MKRAAKKKSWKKQQQRLHEASNTSTHTTISLIHESEKQNTSKNVILFLDADHLRRERNVVRLQLKHFFRVCFSLFHISLPLVCAYVFFVPSCHKSSRIPLNMGPIGGISGPKTSIFRHSYIAFSDHKCDRKSWIIFVSKGIHWTYYIVLNPLARQPKWLETASNRWHSTLSIFVFGLD